VTDQWDRFAASADRALGALGFEDTVAVFQPTETYSVGEGYALSYPDSPTTTVDGGTEPPSETADTDRGGTTTEADLVVYVRADTGVQWTGAGESGEANTRLEVDGADERYEVDEVEPQFDGWLLLACSEVDT